MPFLLALATSLLFGCGASSLDSDSVAESSGPLPIAESDGTAPRSPATQSIQALTKDDRPVIVMFGDSLTEGYGLPRGKNFPDFLQSKLDDQGYRYSVRNEGISGDTTSGGLMRCSLVASSVPAIAVVALGGNDGLRGLSLERMKDNLRRIVQEFSVQGTQVVIGGMKLPPNYGAKYTDSFERVFHELAQELHVPLIPFLLEGVGGHPEFMQDDGIHPNEEGAHKIATLVMEHLQPLLAKR